MKHYIYADNAATTKLDVAAFEAMRPFLLEEYGNASQPYSFSRSVKTALKRSRQMIAECIGAQPDEIYFTSGGTEGDNWAIKGSFFSDNKKKTIITSQIEHHAILNACTAIERLGGCQVIYLPVDTEGSVKPDTLEQLITDDTRLVSVMLSNNEIGTIQPIKTLANIAHQHGALFHTDAVQAVGHIKIDVNVLGVDMLSASAHKFNGPKGIGFLYIRKDTKIVPFCDGGTQEFGMRAGTENIPFIVGMAVALKNNCDFLNENQEYIRNLENTLLSGLKKKNIDFVRNGINQIPGNLNLSFKGKDGEAILHRLDLQGIAISTGSACDSVNTQVSHVLQAIKLNDEYAKGTIRITLGKNNSIDDVDSIVSALYKVLKS